MPFCATGMQKASLEEYQELITALRANPCKSCVKKLLYPVYRFQKLFYRFFMMAPKLESHSRKQFILVI
jgi:hypothetical protein